MKFLKIEHPIESGDLHTIEEYYKERFYGAITVMALNITLLFSQESITSETAFFLVLSTVLGLWTAGVFASIVSARVVHKTERMQSKRVTATFLTHRGILQSGFVTLLIVGLSIFFEFLDLETALQLSLILSLLRISVTVIDALAKNDRHFFYNALSVFLQILAVCVVIFLKNLSEK